MACINTRNWQAFEDRQPGTSAQNPFYVIGEVETNNGAIQPVLTMAKPQGINDKILILDLTLNNTGGIGTADVSYRPVRYDEQICEAQYTDVQVMYEGEQVAAFEVTIVS